MNIEEFRAYCISKKGATESFPFDDVTLVFKVMNKMFALLNLDESRTANLKCDPEWAIELREKYADIIPGYHMSKIHWNTLLLDGYLPSNLIYQLIDHSYDLVIQKLTKKQKEELSNL
ncbi:MAG: MmcQ/YjbR family DNA-binding protein [Marinilabiliaceae bacterium]|nr:MmcQ/YjbR family DNA-binding protein [Marinilabiliaceae bacterium]